jgi:hypothetical protein
MGSFNASCAVSKCSINPGDRVKLIPIVSTTSLHSQYSTDMHKGFGCYCYDYFTFLGLPMDATYEDYGNFEMVDNFNSQYNLAIIKENYTSTPMPANKTYVSDRDGYDLKAEDLDWEKIGELIHFGNMNLDSTSDLSRRKFMGYFPIHESVYNLMMQRRHEMYFNNHFQDVSLQEYFDNKVQELSGNSREFEEKVTEYMDLFGDSIGETNKFGQIITAEEIYDKAVRMAQFSLESHSNRVEYSYKNSASKSNINTKYNEITGKVLEGQNELDVIRSMCELTFVVCALNAFQIPILPPMTAGQEYDKTEHASFLVKMGSELMNLQQESEDEENVAVAKISAKFDVSLQRMKERAEDDYRPERGAVALALINDLVLEYPDGVEMTAVEFNASKYSILGQYLSSSLFDVNFIVDFIEEGEK